MEIRVETIFFSVTTYNARPRTSPISIIKRKVETERNAKKPLFKN